MQDSSQVDMGEKYKNWMKTLAWQVVIAIKAGKEVAGEEYLKKLEEELYNYGVGCAGLFTGLTGVKGGEPDCIALGKVMDAIDDSVANWWDGYVENSPTAFEKHIINCPVAEHMKHAPEYCERLVPATLRGVLQILNPKVTITFDSYLSKGDKTCHYRVEIRD